MKINEAGLDLIKKCEGFSLKAYPDPATGGAPWTIGYGHTGTDIHPTSVWTEKQCEDQLIADCSHAAYALSGMVKVSLTDNQVSALISLVFNIGRGNFLNSTLLKLLNEKDYVGAANEFPKWDRAAGREIPGLKNRRLLEQQLFNT